MQKAKKELQDVVQAVNDGVPVDIAQIDFTGAWDPLGEITGESAPDELITTL
ncbi:MAG: tRNA uridine-5-carboxymethylaminomethyl(34) synthesis GTPase MnmE, partial [Candidatus Ventricola sp.]